MTQASASAATAIIQQVIGDAADDQKRSQGGVLIGGGSGLQPSIVLSSQDLSQLQHVQVPNVQNSRMKLGTGRRKRKSTEQGPSTAPPTKRPRGRPKGSGVKKPSIAAAPTSLQAGPPLLVPQKRRGRKPKTLIPKPPPLQKIVESAAGSSGEQSGTQVNSSGGSYGISNNQITANVSSVNVMIPAATPTVQVQDASAPQVVGGKKKVRWSHS